MLAEGPSVGALVQTPVMKAMQEGKIGRIEELTRIGLRCAGYTDHHSF
ncbi:AAA family ATPase [Bacteroides thetaiotaomicron]|nr:AAA family ATPase [Bacteroides thetaiotaomicron]